MISESEVVEKTAPSRSRRSPRRAEIDEVAVVSDGEQALGGLDRDGLGVEKRGVAGGGVAGVADGDVAGQALENGVGKDLADEAHALHVGDVLAIRGGDAGGLLAAMLEGVEAPVGHAGGVVVVIDGHDPHSSRSLSKALFGVAVGGVQSHHRYEVWLDALAELWSDLGEVNNVDSIGQVGLVKVCGEISPNGQGEGFTSPYGEIKVRATTSPAIRSRAESPHRTIWKAVLENRDDNGGFNSEEISMVAMSGMRFDPFLQASQKVADFLGEGANTSELTRTALSSL